MNLIIRLNQNTLRSIRSSNKNRGILPELRISRLRFAIDILPRFFLNKSKFVWGNSNNGTIAFVELGDLEWKTADAEVVVVRNAGECPEEGTWVFCEGIEVGA
jgi:hypothetical protein